VQLLGEILGTALIKVASWYTRKASNPSPGHHLLMYITDMAAFYALTGQVAYRMTTRTQISASIWLFGSRLCRFAWLGSIAIAIVGRPCVLHISTRLLLSIASMFAGIVLAL